MISIEMTRAGTRTCGFWFGKDKRCIMPSNRILNGALLLCHLHAMEAEQGYPVLELSAADRDRIMRELAA